MSKAKPKAPPDTLISLTLPGSGGITRTATLVARRGDLSAIKQFPYANLNDLAQAIRAVTVQLNSLELNPPALPEAGQEAPPPAEESDDIAEVSEAPAEQESEAIEAAQDEEWAETGLSEEPAAEADPLQTYEDPAQELLDTPPTHLPPGSATQQMEMF